MTLLSKIILIVFIGLFIFCSGYITKQKEYEKEISSVSTAVLLSRLENKEKIENKFENVDLKNEESSKAIVNLYKSKPFRVFNNKRASIKLQEAGGSDKASDPERSNDAEIARRVLLSEAQSDSITELLKEADLLSVNFNSLSEKVRESECFKQNGLP